MNGCAGTSWAWTNKSRSKRRPGKQLRTAIDALRYDPKAVERLAREKFGYAKPGETVIRFEEPQTNYPVQR